MKRWLVVVGIGLMLVACAPLGTGEGGELQYAGPVEIGIVRGELLPGTDIQYLGKVADGAQVSIGGEQALKKTGDSLNWEGDLMDGVAVELDLRVAVITEEELHVVGTVQVTVSDPDPRPEPVNSTAPIRYKVPVAYRVEQGDAIPGSVVTYLGKTDDGAHLGNVDGYAYRQPGDSIVWEGKIRDRVWIELDLRTVLFTDDALNVAGTAELRFAP
jgi:hypothetical protein